MSPIIVTGYSDLASALVNNDFSGIEDDSGTMMDYQDFISFLDRNFPGYRVVSCMGESRLGYPDNGGLKGNVIDYTLQ